MTGQGSVTDMLQSALQAFLDSIAGDPNIHRILTSDPGGVAGLADRRRDTLGIIADLVVQHAPAKLDTQLDAESLRRTALFITGGVNQLIEGWLDGTITMSTAELAAECARLSVNVLNS